MTAGRVGVGEAVLNGEAVEGVGVVGGPDLIGVAQDAEVDAAAAAGAGLDLELGMLGAQLIEDGVEVLNVGDVDLLADLPERRRASRARTSCGCSPT